MNDNPTHPPTQEQIAAMPVGSDSCLAIEQSATPPLVAPGFATICGSPMAADECRTKILEQFNTFQPYMQAYAEYAERISALSIQYHNARLSDVLNVPIEEYVLLTS